MERGGALQRIGRPKYKDGDMVFFYITHENEEYECYGRVILVDDHGTLGQAREVSYDIMGPDYRDKTKKMLYKYMGRVKSREVR